MLREREVKNLKGSLSVAQISELKGKPWTWIIRRVVPFKDQIELPAGAGNIRELQIPHNVFVRIDFADETETPAGDWMTTTTMADELQVDYKWVNRRILQIETIGEFRIGVNGPKLHFPQEALEELREIRNKALVKVDNDNYFNVTQLSEILGRHSLWVNNRLDKLDIEPILGLDASGKAIEFYPRSVLEMLVADKDKFKNATGELTIPIICKLTGKDRDWVIDQLEDIGATAVYKRFSNSGRVDLCFDQGVGDQLLDKAKKYIKPEEGWYTEHALVVLTGKSRNWVVRRIEKNSYGYELLTDIHGVIRKHYPPEVKDKLLGMVGGWKVSAAFDSRKKIGEENELDAERFREIYKRAGVAITIIGFAKLGVSQAELDSWLSCGLITKWKSGQYHFTEYSKTVIDRINQAVTAEEKLKAALEEFSIWVEEDAF